MANSEDSRLGLINDALIVTMSIVFPFDVILQPKQDIPPAQGDNSERHDNPSEPEPYEILLDDLQAWRLYCEHFEGRLGGQHDRSENPYGI